MAGVRTTSPDYDTFLPKWQRVRDVIAGQDAMQKAAEKYLPKLKAENDRSYEARVGRSDHFNATWRTIDALVGMAGSYGMAALEARLRMIIAAARDAGTPLCSWCLRWSARSITASSPS